MPSDEFKHKQEESQKFKSLLNDIITEIDNGEFISDDFTISGHKYNLRTVNEEENNWCYQFVNPGNPVTIATTMRLPMIAIATKSIDDIPIEDILNHKWMELSEDDKTAINNSNDFAKKYFIAEHWMQILSQRSPTLIKDFWTCYELLEARKAKAQDSAKKSSGEDSEKEEKQSTTESSPNGDQ